MGRFLQIFSLLVLLGAFSRVSEAKNSEIPEGYKTSGVGYCRVAVPERNAGLSKDLLRACLEARERVYRQVGLWPVEVRKPIDIRVVGEPSEMEDVVPEGMAPPGWSEAVAYPDLGLIVLSLRSSIGSPVRDLDIVLEHEMSHLAVRQALGGAPVPKWFTEGIAVQQSEKSSFRRLWVVWLAARGNTLLPLQSIERYPEKVGQINLAYAQAADFVGFLLRREGWLGIRIVLRRCARGETFPEAFEFAFRDNILSLEKEWQAGLKDRWKWLPLLTGTGAVWGAIVILFLIAYAMAKRKYRLRLKEMTKQEELIDRLASLEDRDLGVHFPVDTIKRPPTKIRVDDEIHTLH